MASDYSYLIRSIEGRISHYVPNESVVDNLEKVLKPDTSSSYNNQTILNESDISGLENFNNIKKTKRDENVSTPSFEKTVSSPVDYLSTAKKLRLAVETDELKLLNEQLLEKNVQLSNEYERLKEKMLRQLNFLDQENLELRQAVTKSNEKYYEEKKQWQTKLRTIEAEKSSLIKQLQQAKAIDPAKPIRPVVVPSQLTRDEIASFEAILNSKAEEVKKFKITNARLEERVSELESEIKLVRSRSIAQDLLPTDSAPIGDFVSRSAFTELERQRDELQSQLRRKTRELEKHVSKLENQSVLEDEAVSLRGRLQQALSRVAELQQVESKYATVLQERTGWVGMLKDVTQMSKSILSNDYNDSFSPSGSGTATSEELLTPAAAIRMLSATQKKCVEVMHREGVLITKVQELKRLNQQLETSEKTARESLRLAIEDRDDCMRHSRLLQQKAKLYTSEIDSLRELMKTYDAEFQIGRRASNDKESGRQAGNDKLVDDLRKELDSCRSSCEDLINQVSSLQQREKEYRTSASTNVVPTPSLPELVLDYDPSVTKVLHFKQSPITMVSKSAADSINELHALEDAGTGEPLSSTSINASEYQVDTSKLNQRLKEMFKERIAAFREAIYLLSGFKVDLISGGGQGTSQSEGQAVTRLRLRSMYSEHPDDSLLFQLRNGTLELLDTPFAERLDPKLFTYLSTCHSVPCFLANVTLQLFENQTFLG